MLDRFLDACSSESSGAIRKTWCLRVRRARRHVPQLEDALERREVLSPFPFTGTFSGSYSVYAESDGTGPNQQASGTISVTLAASSIQQLGENLYNAYLYGSLSFTGFVGQSGTFPIFGSSSNPPAIYNQSTIGLETGVASTGIEPSVDIDIQAFKSNQSSENVFIEGYCTNNSIVASLDISVGNYTTPNAAAITLTGATLLANALCTDPSRVDWCESGQSEESASQVVVDFSGPLGGGSGLPLSDFQLTTVAKGKKHAKVIPLAGVAYDPTFDTVTLTLRRRLNVRTPLRLTVSGLGGGSSTLILDKR